MSIKNILKLSLKYTLRYKRRYRFLFLALAFGFAVIFSLSSVKAGISENLYTNAQSHYAGDIVFLGLDGDSSAAYYRHLDAESKKAVYETLREVKIDVFRIAERTLFNDNATVFFAGESLFLRYLQGVDWRNEEPYFKKLSYSGGAGSGTGSGANSAAPEQEELNGKSIIISSLMAEQLHVKRGDSVIIEAPNRFGQKNTGEFIVAAIMNDSSLFSMSKAYISRPALNSLLGFEEDDCSSIGVFFKNREAINKNLETLHGVLRTKIQTAAIVLDGKSYKEERSKQWSGIKIFLLTIPVYVADLYQLIEALNLLSYFLFVMMLLIILVSASVTYRLILHERTIEIGTMMALGFSKRSIALMLGSETFILGSVSIAAGLALGKIFTAAAGVFPANKMPGFDIMLSGGSLGAVFDPIATALSIVAVYIVLIAAVSFPMRETTRSPLRELLSGSAKS